jgi:lipid A 3-O-deacylase
VRRALATLTLALTPLLAAPAAAEEGRLVEEVKVGAFIHDFQYFKSRNEGGGSLGLEMLFRSPAFLAPVFAPRPHLGVIAHSAGVSHHLYGGLTWELPLPLGLFLAGSFGLDVHTGETSTERSDRVGLGSRVLFRSAGELGLRLAERHSLSLLLSHMSHARLSSDRNPGLNHLGVRYGLRL